MPGHIILSHGLSYDPVHGVVSGPDATKVTALAELAESQGWNTERPDYREDDAQGMLEGVLPRIVRLQRAMHAAPCPPVLVGSSMGAFISGLAARDRPVAGLFLLATPSEIPGFPQSFELPVGVPALLIHGWQDDVCLPGPMQAFAAQRRLPLLMLDDDHRLGASLDTIEALFTRFLQALA